MFWQERPLWNRALLRMRIWWRMRNRDYREEYRYLMNALKEYREDHPDA